MRQFLLFALCMTVVACGRTGATSPAADTSPLPSPSPTAAGADTYVFTRADDGNGPYSLAGDHNGWTLTPMQLESGTWTVEVEIEQALESKYKFVDAAGNYAADATARTYGYDEFGEFSLVDSEAAHLERFVVGGRRIRVRVPAAATAVTHHLYVHDGQNLFTPDAPWGGWQLQEHLGDATLAIGVDSDSQRVYDYTHVPDLGTGGGGDAYVDFVENELRPAMEQEFGTAGRVGVMGSSLGGLIALHQGLRHDGRYDFVASLSGTLGWGAFEANNETMIDLYGAAGQTAMVLYVDSGGGPGSGCVDTDGDGINDDSPDALDNYCENRQMADVLAGVGYEYDSELWHWWEPDAPHNEAAWAARVSRPIAIFEGL